MFHASHFGRVVALLALAPLLIVGAGPARAAEQACFPETGFCIEGRFRDYWAQNGGLAVFGFPIGPAQSEVNRETGQAYLTQWFERNRFELHSENAAPYDVLLGRLGDDLLHQQGIDWQLQPRESGPRAGCLWFAQTGHNVCDQAPGLGFQSYWQSHGLRDQRLDAYGRSLALFGLPLTDARPEINLADGQTYLTQWFERARLEWHPDKPDAYKVLLGLLGNEASTRRPAMISDNVVGRPVSSGGFLFWSEPRGERFSLFGRQIATGFTYTVSNQVESIYSVAVDGDSIAWIERSPDQRRQYVLLDTIPTHGRDPGDTERVILNSGGNDTSIIMSIALAGGVLYYEDTTFGHGGLYAHDIASGRETLIDPIGRNPVAGSGVLLWSTFGDNGQANAGYRQTWALHLRELASGADRVIATAADFPSGGFGEYAVSGDDVVYAFSAPGADNRVYRYRIGSGQRAPISPDAASSPSIRDGLVAWATNPYFDRDPGLSWAVQTYDLRRGAIVTIAAGLDPKTTRFVALAAGHVAYETYGGHDNAQVLNLSKAP